MNKSDLSHFNFSKIVKEYFSFLKDLGFCETVTLPTLVCYENNNVKVDVYHGRQSYEVGLGVTAFGARYSMEAIIRHSDPIVAQQYRNYAATTPEGILSGLQQLSFLVKSYALLALDGDPEFFSMLAIEQKIWSQDYASEVLADKLRPEAEECFRKKNYLKAADLYSRIKSKLSPAELEKLRISESCSKISKRSG